MILSLLLSIVFACAINARPQVEISQEDQELIYQIKSTLAAIDGEIEKQARIDESEIFANLGFDEVLSDGELPFGFEGPSGEQQVDGAQLPAGFEGPSLGDPAPPRGFQTQTQSRHISKS